MRYVFAFSAILFATPAFSDPATIEGAEARASGGAWSFSVTLSHGDTGWDDYADGWRVVAADGTVLGTRELMHPHVNEQPFTRSLSGVAIPDGTATEWIEDSTNTGGWAGEKLELSLQ